MSITLRQLQKMFSLAARGGKNTRIHNGMPKTLGSLARLISDNHSFSEASIGNGGELFNNCTCRECQSHAPVVPGARSHLDRWVREYGHKMSVQDLIAAEMAKRHPPEESEQPGQGQGSGGQSTQDQDEQGQNSQQGRGQQGNGLQSGDQTQMTGPASEPAAEQEPAVSSPPPVPDQPKPSPQQRAIESAKSELKDALEAAAKKGAKPKDDVKVKAARRRLKHAKKKVSFNAKAEASGVSLSARQQVSRGLGRLQRVSQKLRNQMAELINRLVEQGGTVGETFGTVPVMSATKLVKRMVVRRPLPNALKEDTIAGRPVVLFLPDISPSCAAQAQVACDLANAAGAAGVSGSDVLVLPHFNGGVESSEEYIPWFNGKPAATSVREAETLFHDVCSGRSRYRVRVAVFLGDHDAVDHYGSIASLRSVTRVLWLHNFSANRGGKKGWPEPAAGRLLPDWRPEARAKLSMVAGCVDQSRMLAGFDMALKMK